MAVTEASAPSAKLTALNVGEFIVAVHIAGNDIGVILHVAADPEVVI